MRSTAVAAAETHRRALSVHRSAWMCRVHVGHGRVQVAVQDPLPKTRSAGGGCCRRRGGLSVLTLKGMFKPFTRGAVSGSDHPAAPPPDFGGCGCTVMVRPSGLSWMSAPASTSALWAAHTQYSQAPHDVGFPMMTTPSSAQSTTTH